MQKGNILIPATFSPPFSLSCPHDRQWFWPTFLWCETKLSNGNSKWYLKYSSLLTNTVFSFLFIFFTISILLYCLEICSEVSSDSPCQLYVFQHYGYSFCMNGTDICLLQKPYQNASPTSCSAKTTELCNFNPSLHLCTISLTSLWKGTLWISKSLPPSDIFVSCLELASLIGFLFVSLLFHLWLFVIVFLFYLLSSVPSFDFPLSIFSYPLIFYHQLPWPSPSLLFLLTLWLSLPFLIMEDGLGLILIYFLSSSIFLTSKWIQNEIHQPEFNTQHFKLSTKPVI